MEQDRDGHDEVLRKEPCPDCGSKDNLVRYRDGHAHCFTPGCDHRERGEEGGRPSAPAKAKYKAFLTPDRPDAFGVMSDRRLKGDTLQRFGFFRGTLAGKGCQVAPYYDQAGELAHQKCRFADKTFAVISRPDAPPLTQCRLFGQQVYGDRFDKRVVVHVGEHDAMSVDQAMDRKVPAVSCPTGDQGAVKALKANYRWLDRFAEIVLWFDDDESGRSVVDECAKLFDVGKVKVARAPGFKDASEVLQANKPGDITAAVYAATAWRPRGIINASMGLEMFTEAGLVIPEWPYPWANLEDRTRGMRLGEVSYHVGGTGASKTTILYHLAWHLMNYTQPPEKDWPEDRAFLPPTKVGWLGFEDTVRSVKVGVMSVAAGQRLHLKPIPKKEIAALHERVFGSGRLELYDPENAEWGFEAITGYVRYLARALDCGVVFLDPMSFVSAMLGLATDERRALDKASVEFAALAKSLNIHLHISHHLKRPDGTSFEDGRKITLDDIKGAGGLAHFSSNVFGYERDQQGARADLMRVRALKIRATGFTASDWGPYRDHQMLKYDAMTGRYTETDEAWPEAGGDGGKGRGGFGRSQGSTAGFGTDY